MQRIPEPVGDPAGARPTPVPGTLIVSATRIEAAYVPADAQIVITGIGKVRAALALTRVLATATEPVAQIINIGTVGALRPAHAGALAAAGGTGLYLPSTVIEHDISSTELQAMGYPVVDRWEIPSGDGTVLATGDTFIADVDRRDGLARIADLVDMEGAAIAQVSAAFGVPCRLVKAVTDDADDSAIDWPQLVDAAARRLADWVAENVSD